MKNHRKIAENPSKMLKHTKNRGRIVLKFIVKFVFLSQDGFFF